MKARHITSEREYRSPFGALRLGDTVRLAVEVWDADVVFCTLRVWTDAHGEELVEMRGTPCAGRMLFSATYHPREVGVVWYSFDIEAADGAVWRYGARPGWTTGEGAFAYGDPPSFQLTVYRPRAVRPAWYEDGVAYQVFPDRFARGADFAERARTLDAPRRGPVRRLVDWDKDPSYERAEDGSIRAWDFYGGTLQGIREHLGYLQDLGVSVLYLNPIFEAASNHRYDTADYLRVDPLLGTEEDFRELCEDAEARGIGIVLDGVFNHSGQDSRYFNAYGNYPGRGAAQGKDSPYRGWYRFRDDGTYDAWWGVRDLPAFDESNEGFRELVCGRDGVVRHWLRAGARGWRLDVADELSDELISKIRHAMLSERGDAVLLGEVWEDASNKVAYGRLRQYLEGDELDGTMNYPLREGVLEFLRGETSAPLLAARLEQLRENYPPEALRRELNLLGSHDRARLFSLLGGCPDPDGLDDGARRAWHLSDDQASLAASRLWVAALLQMCMPGVPCVYYGDELGLEGLTDPYNRASMPWDGSRGRRDCLTTYRNAIALRRTLPVLAKGDFEPFASGPDVLGVWRWSGSERVCVLANRSLGEARTVRVPMADADEVSDVVSGSAPHVERGQAEVFLWPLGTAVLHFHDRVRLQRPLEPGMGVLCHVTSVPNGGRPGTLGAPGRRFVDWLASAGQRYWQVLPVNPADGFGSPYAGLAAFAGDTGLLERPCDEVLEELHDIGNDPDYQEFCENNEYWLRPYCTFCALKELHGGAAWQDWPAADRRFSPAMAHDPRLTETAERARRLQFEFDREWRDLVDYAHGRGVMVIGDMPMFVSADSADVWSEPDVFDLGDDGRPARMAGAPGDAFAPEGQLWGNPTYRWDVLRERGYDWWLRRLGRAMALYDYVRLDHFIGFSSYYAIPAGGTPADGAYAYGPGAELFEAAHAQFGPLPFVAEDLGMVTPSVRALVAQTGIPGMDVVQFSDGDVREGWQPRPGTVAYTGTHDNQTLVGFAASRLGAEGPDEARELAERVMGNVLASDADVAIVQLQDVLGLGDEARMNVPGTAGGNWSWHADEAQVLAAADHLRELAREHGRLA